MVLHPSAMNEGGVENGTDPATPAQMALRRRFDDTITWIDGVTDPDWLDAVLASELSIVAHMATRARTLRANGTPAESPDAWLSIDEVARLIRRSVSWIRHQPADAIPGRRQHMAGGKVTYSRNAVLAWLHSHTAAT